MKPSSHQLRLQARYRKGWRDGCAALIRAVGLPTTTPIPEPPTLDLTEHAAEKEPA